MMKKNPNLFLKESKPRPTVTKLLMSNFQQLMNTLIVVFIYASIKFYEYLYLLPYVFKANYLAKLKPDIRSKNIKLNFLVIWFPYFLTTIKARHTAFRSVKLKKAPFKRLS